MKKLFIAILFILNINVVKAYENDFFTIDIPKDYKLEIEENNSYKWAKDNNYIAITISNNQELNYNISTYTKTDIENQKRYIENNINKELKDYNVKVTVTNIEKIKLNNKDVLNYNIYWPTKDTTGYDTYQIGNIFTTDKYITTIVYSSDKDIKDDNEYHNIINSVKIKDVKISNNSPYITTAIIAALILAIIRYIIKYKKKLHK